MMEHLCEIRFLVAMVLVKITMVTSMGDMPGMPGHNSPTLEDTCQQPKTRIINYSDLQRTGMHKYQKRGVADYAKLVIDYTNDQLLVGARNLLLQLNLDNLNEIQAANWSPNDLTVNICRSKGESEENCCNYIRVLLIHQDHIFSCGTNAFSPLCTWRRRSNLTNVIGEVTGIARCPYNPQHNTTSLITEQGDLYSATVMDFTARDPVVYRTLGPSPALRTAQLNSKWLNEPNFVASYEIGPFVYFFFRESAVEYMNCGKVVYSRIARVCKNDIGGEFLLEDNWTTFMKARLNCSLPGEYPFHFNELQSTYYDKSVQMIYAVYSTPRNSIHGSAVCAYHMSAIEAAFQGPFKFQRNAHSAWVSQPNSNPDFNCNVLGNTHSRPLQTARELLEAQKYQLMDEAVQPTEMKPLFIDTRPEMRVDQIVVDIVEGKYATYHVMFLGTESGKVLKVVKLPNQKDACVLEELCVTPEDECQPLKTMQLHHDKGAIYVGLPDAIVKVNTQRCHALLTRSACINARDPYCGWDSHHQKCTTKPHLMSALHHWHQDISGCPIVQARVDGKFGPWSNWFECRNPTDDSHCLCRQRSCDDPEPKCGGFPCVGETMQVSNCSGTSVVTLRTNTGKWSEWSGWSRCSSPCNGGIQTRTRKCEAGKMCSGTPEETRECNKQMCTVMRKATPWTPWMVKNVSEDGFLLQRYRFQCKAPVIDRSLIKVGRMKKDYKFCPYMSTKCWPSATSFGGWTLWSPWLPCSASCGQGQQVRYRTCFPGSDQCVGPPHEMRSCMVLECPVDGGWSCWTDWTQCSESCGGGTRQRYRHCNNPIPSENGHDCFGDPIETGACNEHECTTPSLASAVSTIRPTMFTNEGWRKWSSWTSCNSRGRKHRSRKCEVSDPSTDECIGCVKQVLRCEDEITISDGLIPPNVFEVDAPEVQKLAAAPPKCSTPKESMDPVYLLVVGLVSAVAGGIMSVSVFHSWSKSKRHQEQMSEDEYDDDDEDEFNEEDGSEEGEYDRYSDCEYYEMHNGQVRRDGIPIETQIKDAR